MKMIMTNDEYIRIEPCVIEKKSEGNIFYDPMKGLQSTVVTYKVVDCNGEKKFKDKIIGVHRANVYLFDTSRGKFHVVDKKAVVFIAEPDEDEEILNEEEIKKRKDLALSLGQKKSSLIL